MGTISTDGYEDMRKLTGKGGKYYDAHFLHLALALYST